VLAAIRQVLKGDFYVDGQLESRLLRSVAGAAEPNGARSLQHLSDRELEVFRLLGHGQGTRHIANDLGLSVKTVEAHVARVRAKLGLKNANELLQQATLWVERTSRWA